MSKKNLIFIIFLLLFVVSGCSLEVNLTINDKNKIKDKTVLKLKNEVIISNNTSVKEYLNSLISSYSDTDFKLKKIIGDDKSGLIFSTGYKDINAFFTNSEYNSLYPSYKINIKNGTLDFSSGEGDYESIFDDGPDPLAPSLDELKINIKFYNEVVENNADSYDKNNNTYTWIITNEKKPESISFKTSKKIRYDIMFKDLVEEYLVSAIIFCVGVSLIIFLVLRFKRKINFNNEV